MIDTFRKLMDLLDARERRRFWLLAALMLVMGFANMIGIASVLPFLTVMADPSLIERNEWLSAAYVLSGADNSTEFLAWLGAGVALAYMGALAFRAATTYAQLRFAALRNHSLAQRMLDGYLAQPYPWHLGRHSADLAKNVLTEVSQVVNSVLTPLLGLMSNAVIVLFLFGLLIAVNPWIALFITGLLGGAYVGIFFVLRPRMARLGRARMLANRERFQVVQEGLGGIKEVKVQGLEASLRRRFAEPSLRMAEASSANAAIGDLPRFLLEGLAFGGMMAAMLVLALLSSGNLSEILPVAGVYALAGSRMAPAMQMVYVSLSTLRFGKPGLDALHADLAAMPSARSSEQSPGNLIHLREQLSLQGVEYAYPGAEGPALRGISLDIPAKATVGVVGGTGAGKTTVIDVIMGLLEPQGGRLIVDGRPIVTEKDRRAWRRSVGYVPQQIFLVDASVAENIAFGLPRDEIDPAAVERAARLAQLHDFVTSELPKGYETMVGDRGVRLSGGQRQRIGIARALYHDPDVLVLDEATSALDNITERALMEAVRGLGGKKTVIMIAHRLTTVMGCDEVFLLERGRVADRGSYARLIETSPAFRVMAIP